MAHAGRKDLGALSPEGALPFGQEQGPGAVHADDAQIAIEQRDAVGEALARGLPYGLGPSFELHRLEDHSAESAERGRHGERAVLVAGRADVAREQPIGAGATEERRQDAPPGEHAGEAPREAAVDRIVQIGVHRHRGAQGAGTGCRRVADPVDVELPQRRLRPGVDAVARHEAEAVRALRLRKPHRRAAAERARFCPRQRREGRRDLALGDEIGDGRQDDLPVTEVALDGRARARLGVDVRGNVREHAHDDGRPVDHLRSRVGHDPENGAVLPLVRPALEARVLSERHPREIGVDRAERPRVGDEIVDAFLEELVERVAVLRDRGLVGGREAPVGIDHDDRQGGVGEQATEGLLDASRPRPLFSTAHGGILPPLRHRTAAEQSLDPEHPALWVQLTHVCWHWLTHCWCRWPCGQFCEQERAAERQVGSGVHATSGCASLPPLEPSVRLASPPASSPEPTPPSATGVNTAKSFVQPIAAASVALSAARRAARASTVKTSPRCRSARRAARSSAQAISWARSPGTA